MINPSGIPQIPGDMDALIRYAADLHTAAQNFASTGARVHGAWQDLAGIYVAPEAESLLSSTVPVAQVADRVGRDVEAVAEALRRYAEEARSLQQQLQALRTRASELAGEIDNYAEAGHTTTEIVDSGSAHAPLAARKVPSKDWHDDEDLVARDQQLNNDVAQAVSAWMAAQRRCANAINAVYGGTTYVQDDGDAHQAPNEFGYSTEQLGSSTTPWGGPEQANPGPFDLFADFGHAALDVVGLLPVVGEAADGVNAVWYGAEGDSLNAGLSAAGMVPFAGWAATGGKLVGKGAKAAEAADDVAAVEKKVVDPGGDPARKGAGAGEAATKTDRVAEHLTKKDLEAAQRELRGEVVARKPDGTPFDHVKEVREAQNGLINRIEYLKRQLGDSRLSVQDRTSYQRELSQASRLLEYSEKYMPRR